MPAGKKASSKRQLIEPTKKSTIWHDPKLGGMLESNLKAFEENAIARSKQNQPPDFAGTKASRAASIRRVSTRLRWSSAR